MVVEEFLGQQLRVRAGQALQLGSTHRGGEGVVESGAKASDYLHRALGDHYHATTQVGTTTTTTSTGIIRRRMWSCVSVVAAAAAAAADRLPACLAGLCWCVMVGGCM